MAFPVSVGQGISVKYANRVRWTETRVNLRMMFASAVQGERRRHVAGLAWRTPVVAVSGDKHEDWAFVSQLLQLKVGAVGKIAKI